MGTQRSTLCFSCIHVHRRPEYILHILSTSDGCSSFIKKVIFAFIKFINDIFVVEYLFPRAYHCCPRAYHQITLLITSNSHQNNLCLEFNPEKPDLPDFSKKIYVPVSAKKYFFTLAGGFGLNMTSGL